MNLKSVGISALMLGTVTASVVVAAPARAASIAGETLNFGGNAQLLTPDGPNSKIDFSPKALFTGPDGSPFGDFGDKFDIADLDLLRTGTDAVTGFGIWELAGSEIEWLTGLPNGVKYTLQTFSLKQLAATAFEADIAGIFAPSQLDGTGAFTSQGSFKIGPTSYSATIDVGKEIPTPALLPGLIGMGVAALRKRGSSEEETVEA